MSAPLDTAGTGTDTAADAPRPATAPRLLVSMMLLVVALGALGLVGLGAAADRGPGTVYDGATTRAFSTAPPRHDYSEPDWHHEEQPPTPENPESSNTWIIVVLSVLGVLLLAAAAWVIHRMRSLARPAPALADLADEDELTTVQARAALEDARTRLSTVMGAHDAVIAAWLALERAIAEAGVRRAPSQTTLEFVVAVLGDLDLDRPALDRLAHLYRRALFDAEPLVETDRDEAMVLLDRLTDELEDGTDGDGAR